MCHVSREGDITDDEDICLICEASLNSYIDHSSTDTRKHRGTSRRSLIMSSVTDSVVFRGIFSTPASSAIWSDKKRTQYYLDFEAALAVVQARLGIIPVEAGESIKEKCDVDQIDMDELAAETKRIGYPVLPVVKQLVKMVNAVEPGLGEWAHWGATTQVRI
ncbi:hypothetical protein BDQ12DRAFT_678016 [Crucibulum laeve]|uniref:Uncharacterized protein n=1 Tax=Crucibulum laeve TaxID=68775 RepID=A0A5C3MJT8_9AGAR|nr:hypothetical protein BDQ12DRAFT_678016 [Crucibulum laeve]